MEIINKDDRLTCSSITVLQSFYMTNLWSFWWQTTNNC